MSGKIHYTGCPVCENNAIKQVLTAKDYTVSNEMFAVWECSNCTLRFTQDVPGAEGIGPYYQSSAYVSHSDTKEGLINRLYHFVRGITLKSKRNLIKQDTGLEQGSLLDIGAGTGAFSHTMQQAGWQVTGLEPDAAARKVALDKHNLQLQLPEQLYHLPTDTFDAITMWHVLEHVHDLHGYLKRFHAVLKTKGRLFIAVPNYTSYDAQVYNACWAAYDVPRHLYHFSPQSMQLLAEANGFTVKAFKPMWFDSFYVSMLSEPYRTGKENLLRAYWNGCISNMKAMFDAKKCSSIIYVLSKQ